MVDRQTPSERTAAISSEAMPETVHADARHDIARLALAIDPLASVQAWWQQLRENNAKRYLAQISEGISHLAASHTVEAIHNGQPTGQKYEIFEFGDTEIDPIVVGAISKALELTDQYSGGYLSTPDGGVRIILDTYDRTVNAKYNAFVIRGTDIVYLNLTKIRESCIQAGVPLDEGIRQTVIHEVLGHRLEHSMEGYRGMHARYFEYYFSYSLERESGILISDIHSSVTSHDPAHAESQPVREYGRRSPGEDLATTVDAIVTDAEGWQSAMEGGSEVDEYRRDIALTLMGQAATRAYQHPYTPGFVGSELRYYHDENGIPISADPARYLKLTTRKGDETPQRKNAERSLAHVLWRMSL